MVAAAALVAIVVTVADRTTTRTATSRQFYKFLNVVLGLETIGLIATTYSKLALYVRGFGVTMLRLSVAWFLAWLTVAVIIVVGSVIIPKWNAMRTAKLIYVTLGLWVVGFGVIKPS